MTTLAGVEIRERGLIENGSEVNYRAASYDLRIGKFVGPEGRLLDRFRLPPQGIVKVVSSEIVRVPPQLVGVVLVKTSLCNEGILALNIGIVDPGYAGPLQSSLLNFGKKRLRLNAGEVFSRIVFQNVSGVGTTTDREVSMDEALEDAQDDVRKYLPATFMDVRNTVAEAARSAFGKYRRGLLLWLPLLAFVVTLLAFGLNFGNMWLLQSYLKPQDQIRTELLGERLEARLSAIERAQAQLRDEVSRRERQPEQQVPSKTSPRSSANPESR